jgi:murein DD-endopeptidase MepM/ murein hydrolase activator NlpD
MMKFKIVIALIIVLLLRTSTTAFAQTPDLPVYIVQSGDTLYTIAYQFNVSMDDILAVNSIENADWLSEGDQIKIPGYEGIQGEFIPYTVQLSDSYHSLIVKQSIDENNFIKINRITSPNEVIAGSNIILAVIGDSPDEETTPKSGVFRSPLINLSLNNATFWENDLQDIYTLALSESTSTISDLSIEPFPLQQGKTSIIHFNSLPNLHLQFLIDDKIIPIEEVEPGAYLSIYGINALSLTSPREFILQTLSDEGSKVLYSQNLLANKTAYPTDPVIIVDPELIDPVKTNPEEEQLFEIASHVTNRDYWEGNFTDPVDEPCIRSPYGSIRSYNNGPYDSFHTGIDFGICADNLNIYAAGSGKVVYAGEWFVRGNSVVIDHGWGIYTGYWHQENIAVQVGDIVQQGQIIGTIGSTGRSTGAHLHWEVLVNDVQVDPTQWLDLSIP